jgi:predicted DCC family thiol-disulfide oxidoreductase YuxK
MAQWKLKLLYDGQCPFCRREVDWLKRRNRRLLLTFEDIADPQFDPAKYGLSRSQVNKELHGLLADGRVVRGMDAVRAAYRAIGLGWLVAPTSLPGVRQAADCLYAAFARNRIALGNIVGRKCQHGACRRGTTRAEATKQA